MMITLADLFRLSHASRRQVVVESAGGRNRIHHNGWVYTIPEDESELRDVIMGLTDGGGGG